MCDCDDEREWTAVDVEDEIVEEMGRDEADAEIAALRADAERYRWIRDLPGLALYIDRGDHSTCYRTAAQEIDDELEAFNDTDGTEIERMKATNTIWRMQVYPTTPIGSVSWNGATLDGVIDAARAEYGHG